MGIINFPNWSLYLSALGQPVALFLREDGLRRSFIRVSHAVSNLSTFLINIMWFLISFRRVVFITWISKSPHVPVTWYTIFTSFIDESQAWSTNIVEQRITFFGITLQITVFCTYIYTSNKVTRVEERNAKRYLPIVAWHRSLDKYFTNSYFSYYHINILSIQTQCILINSFVL